MGHYVCIHCSEYVCIMTISHVCFETHSAWLPKSHYYNTSPYQTHLWYFKTWTIVQWGDFQNDGFIHPENTPIPVISVCTLVQSLIYCTNLDNGLLITDVWYAVKSGPHYYCLISQIHKLPVTNLWFTVKLDQSLMVWLLNLHPYILDMRYTIIPGPQPHHLIT